MLQMLAESLVLSVLWGIGLLLAYLAIPAIRTLSAGGIPRVATCRETAGDAVHAGAASVLNGIIFGLVAAWQSSRGRRQRTHSRKAADRTSAAGAAGCAVRSCGEVRCPLGAPRGRACFAKLRETDQRQSRLQHRRRAGVPAPCRNCIPGDEKVLQYWDQMLSGSMPRRR